MSKSQLSDKTRRWIKQRKKEDQRLEFKKRIDLSTPATKAEFIRDVIALANSGGEYPREEGYLVVGVKDGKCFDISRELYDGATFGQIMHSYISPCPDTSYEEFASGKRRRVGVLVIRPDPKVLYVVQKRLQDDLGKLVLLPGQSWGRRSAGKYELLGSEIQERIRAIMEREIDEASLQLKEKITKLENEGGPALEVKRIRFEIEATNKWQELERLVLKLLPYAREFDIPIKHEVVSAVYEVTWRTKEGMTSDVADAADAVLSELMPFHAGGLVVRSSEEISVEDRALLERIENQAFEITWQACRYLRDTKVLSVGARRYYTLIRYAALNDLRQLAARFIRNLRRCRDTCNELRGGKDFPEGKEIVDENIRLALDIP